MTDDLNALAELKRGDFDLLLRAYRSSGGGVFGGSYPDEWKLNVKAKRLVRLGLAREKPNAAPQQWGFIISTPLGARLVEARGDGLTPRARLAAQQEGQR